MAALIVIAGSWVQSAKSGASASALPPELYFYPPPAMLSDGSDSGGLVTINVEQITSRFPAIPEMAGVVLIVNWSTLCPLSAKCDFSLIDAVLKYWGERGKKVVLSVATVGPPTKAIIGGIPQFISVTPNWVLEQVKTYTATTPTMGAIDNRRSTTERFPRYSDPNFVLAVDGLISALRRYDGNPVVAQIRISTGKSGEDNPGIEIGTPLSDIPGYSDETWMNFSSHVAEQFQRDFSRTQLEFDLLRIGAITANFPAIRPKVSTFVETLIRHHTLLAFNGLRDDTLEFVKSAPVPPRPGGGIFEDLRYLRQAKAAGNGIGLEAFAPMTHERMQNVDLIVSAVNALHPARLVLFPDVAAVINYERNGERTENSAEMRWVEAHSDHAAAVEHINALMQQLGYR